MIQSIKQILPLAYDISIVAMHVVEQAYDITLNEDEAGFLAAHFSAALDKLHNNNRSARALVLTANRKSESLLLKLDILRRFSDIISHLDVVSVRELETITLSDYDVIFSTTLACDSQALRKPVVQINYFLTNNDQKTIQNELLKLGKRRGLLDYFPKDLFFGRLTLPDKETLLRFMCAKVGENVRCDTDMYTAVMNREKLGSTAFTNYVALPHPDCLISDRTIVSVAVLEKPISWGSEQVQTVFLISVQKGAQGEMEGIYRFFSEFIQSKSMVCQLRDDPTFENFSRILASMQ